MTFFAHNKFLTEIERIVDENLQNEQFGVEALARQIGISRTHLHRKLKEKTGQSISQYIREYRLQKAKEMLEKEDVTASEAAYRVGFGSPTYFNKSFRDFFGYTPGEVKQKTSKPAQKLFEASSINSSKSKKTKTIIFLGAIILLSLTGMVLLLNRNAVDKTLTVNEKSIAVLPFKNLNIDAENQYFADGIMDAILNKLAAVGNLKVTSRTSVEKYRENTTKTIPEIASELNVNYILEGSAQKFGGEIRVTAQLINAATDEHFWSRDYTRKFEDILRLQNDIAQNVANDLEVVLTHKEKREMERFSTQNPEAYNYYIQGNFQLNKYTEKGFKNAIPLFEKAIAIDSTFIEPYVGLATIYGAGGAMWGIFNQSDAKNIAIPLLKKALIQDPDNPAIHNIMATILFYYEWDFIKANDHFSRINLKDRRFSLDFYIKMGDLDKALTIVNLFIDNDPTWGMNYPIKAEILYLLGNRKKAVELMDNTYDLFYDNFFYLREAAKLYYIFGENEKSFQALKRLKNNFPDRSPILNWLEAMDAKNEGKDPSSFLNQLKQNYQNNSSGSPAWFIALYFAETGDDEMLFEWLERSFNNREVEMTWLKMEPVLDPYRNDPRYMDLLARMNFPADLP